MGGSTAVMDRMRLQRRPVVSVVSGVWHRILFHVVPGGLLANWIAGVAGLGLPLVALEEPEEPEPEEDAR